MPKWVFVVFFPTSLLVVINLPVVPKIASKCFFEVDPTGVVTYSIFLEKLKIAPVVPCAAPFVQLLIFLPFRIVHPLLNFHNNLIVDTLELTFFVAGRW